MRTPKALCGVPLKKQCLFQKHERCLFCLNPVPAERLSERKKVLGRDSTSFDVFGTGCQYSIFNTGSASKRLYGILIVPSTFNFVEADSAFS